jgi:antitoxin (DNA-binding transcriptional repressor) of toxin-antitoxin stability system
MKSLTIRDLRQKWPEAEKALEMEGEIVITRDGRPVAKLMKFSEPAKPRPRFNSKEHMKRMRKIWGGKVLPSIDERLAVARADRLRPL